MRRFEDKVVLSAVRFGFTSGVAERGDPTTSGSPFSRLVAVVLTFILLATLCLLIPATARSASFLSSSSGSASGIRINFQPSDASIPCGYASDFGQLYSKRASGNVYGWNLTTSATVRTRGVSADQRLDTLALIHPGGRWEIEIPNGVHTVTVAVGDPARRSMATLHVEGVGFFNSTKLDAGEAAIKTSKVDVTDRRLTVDAGKTANSTSLDYIDIDAPGSAAGCDRTTSAEGAGSTQERQSRVAAPNVAVAATATASSSPSGTVASSTPPASPSPSLTTTPTPTPTPSVPPTTLSGPAWINFQPEHTKRPCGFVPDVGKMIGERWGMHYGWSQDERDAAHKRNIDPDLRFDSLIAFHHLARWAIRVRNGVHTVTIGIGDPRRGYHYTLTAEGRYLWKHKYVAANTERQMTFNVDVEDHLLTLTSGSAGDLSTRIDFITIDNNGSPAGCTYPEPSPTPTQNHHRYHNQVGRRPYGLRGLKRVFGKPCNGRANNGRTWFPSARGRGVGGYVVYNYRLSRKVHAIARVLKHHHHGKPVNYGVYGYACRVKRGGTTWSVHSWGAAIDTNSLLNPMGRHHWNGTGSNGHHYGKLIPRTWQRRNFYWGLHFGDPMHFQYVSGY